ncbi:hypothetical protein ISF_08418 [Cordyceps fumosorosea ARSEF 2679]|uniref:Uncharacterized protein n=1 Tax=Cordyceps fumosorosea (strain ARSEF 2679) TaxID=1081104 RepID=A0A167MC58_CORFA|nr:hypothetical protein ISF_08418 [Cordyceps fumosorosea ARSEF 2679]OAA54191.1 hypothetical protein ISF_08418 [Cordyceps fumosorosea ARSEF 2679]
MSLVELSRPATLPAASIPDNHTASQLQSTYNSSTCSSPRPRSLSLSIEQAMTPTATTTTTNSPVIGDISDDMLSIHSTKSESFVSATTSAPALPEKSALRVSRLLATLPQKLPEDRPVLTHAAPHLVYLSSEEDGSSSADDLSDLDSFDSDSEESLDGFASRGEFARAVSVVFSGKPSVVNLTGRSTSLTSLRRTSTDSSLRLTTTEPVLGRMRSTSATSSTTSLSHPPRSSSMTMSADKRRPKFLNVDPFAASKDDAESLKAPKTPTAMFSRAFSSLVKKRSRPTLTPVTREDLVRMEQVGEETAEDDESVSPKSTQAGPIKYQDIVTTAKKNAQQPTPSPATPTSPNGGKNGIRGFSLSRRMSVRA